MGNPVANIRNINVPGVAQEASVPENYVCATGGSEASGTSSRYFGVAIVCHNGQKLSYLSILILIPRGSPLREHNSRMSIVEKVML